jgi:dihydroorotase/N-acyl-D-amino-acid deacylase
MEARMTRASSSWLVVLLLSAAAAHAADAPYDLVLRNARIVDGSGNPWYRADLAVRGDTIAQIAPSISASAKRTIDVNGAVVAPGFIDLHTHAIRGIFQVPTADNYVRQGVTTIMEGPDGGSPVPLRPFLDKLEALQKSLNIGSFVGQGSVRDAVIGLGDRKATPDEIARMRTIVDQAMRDGAFGMSTGLFYVPGKFTPLAEVIELQKVVAPYRGLHTSHMRDEASKIVDSVKETIAIGEQGGVPTQISHHKIIGKAYWGRSVETLKLVDEARARGVDATIDQYPYTASSTSIHAALLPGWALEGGLQETQKRLKDPATRPKVKTAVAELIRTERGAGDPANVVLSRCDWDASLAGKNLSQVSQARGMTPTVENAAEVVMWVIEQGSCQGVFHAMGEEDLLRIIVHPRAGRVCPRQENPHAGRCGAQDVIVPGGPDRSHRPRITAPGNEGGHRDLRPCACSRLCDVRKAAPVRRGFLARHRQRADCLREWRDDGGAPGPGALRSRKTGSARSVIERCRL